jgi:Spore cortex protein YabQ (Spore_YabQ).
MLITGFAAGILYDALHMIKPSGIKCLTAVVDVLVFILTGLAAAGVLAHLKQSQVRYYMVLFLPMGGILYAFMPRRMAIASFRRLKKKFGGKRVKENADE